MYIKIEDENWLFFVERKYCVEDSERIFISVSEPITITSERKREKLRSAAVAAVVVARIGNEAL